MEPTLKKRLVSAFWPVIVGIAAVAASLAGYGWIALALNLFIWGRLLWLAPEFWRTKKRLDQSMVELVDNMLDHELRNHQPTGSYQEYCQYCGAGIRWPCPRYLHAMTIRGESPRVKRRWMKEVRYA